MNASDTWKLSRLHAPLQGARHFPLNISFGPALFYRACSPAPASRGTGISLVVSHNKSVGLPFWFPPQLSLRPDVSLKSVLHYLPKSPCHPSVSAFPKVQTALKGSRGEKWEKMMEKPTFIASQWEIQPWGNYLRNQILSSFSVVWQSLEKGKSLSSQSFLKSWALDKLATLQGTILLIANNYILCFYIRPAVLKVPVPLVPFPFFNGLGIKPQQSGACYYVGKSSVCDL